MKIPAICILLFACNIITAQPVTGVWRGKITNGSGLRAANCKVEIKFVATGDSLVGTAYYYVNTGNYTRYSVKGHFDKEHKQVHWYDDKLLAIKPDGKLAELGVFSESMNGHADYNSPGKNLVTLDGRSQIGTDGPRFTLHFEKAEKTLFKDEWDNLMADSTVTADSTVIDSVYAISKPYFVAQRPDVASNQKVKNEGTGTKEPVTTTAVNITDKAPEAAVIVPAVATEIVKDTVEKQPIKEAVSLVPVPESPKQPDTVAVVNKPAQKTDSVVVARQEDPKPVVKEAVATVPVAPTPKTDSVPPVVAVKKEVPVEPVIAVVQAPFAKADTIVAAVKPIPKPDTVAVEKPIVKESVAVTPVTVPTVKADTVKQTVAVVKEVVPQPAVAVQKVPEPKQDTLAIAKNEVPKPVVTPVERPVVVQPVPNATIVKKEVPVAVQQNNQIISKPVKDTVKPAVAVAPAPKAVPQPAVTKPVTPVPVAVVKKPDTQTIAATVAKQTTAPPVQKPVVQTAPAIVKTDPPKPAPVIVKADPPKPVPIVVKTDPVAEQMFVTREKVKQGEIVIAGDSIELNFYDNAEVDGDSIALFLNGKMLFNHVLLSTLPHTFKIATADIKDGSELTMVAENLGTIPPNTALMLAYIEGQRYSARIESTEKTSGVIKLVRRK